MPNNNAAATAFETQEQGAGNMASTKSNGETVSRYVKRTLHHRCKFLGQGALSANSPIGKKLQALLGFSDADWETKEWRNMEPYLKRATGEVRSGNASDVGAALKGRK